MLTQIAAPQREPVFWHRLLMRIKLVRKFANSLNGIDLTSVTVGDIVELKPHQAVLLIREGWAEPLEEQSSKASEPKNSF